MAQGNRGSHRPADRKGAHGYAPATPVQSTRLRFRPTAHGCPADPQNGLVVATLMALPGDQWNAFVPDGTYDGPDGVEERVMMAFEYADEGLKLRLAAIGGRRDPARIRAALSGQWAEDTRKSPAPPPRQLTRGGGR